MARACEEVGFFYVRNHSITGESIDNLRREAGIFFEQPMDEKMRLKLDQRMRGYLPLDYSSYEGEDRAAKSHQEGFWMSYERALDPVRPMHGPNIWPEDHPALKAAMEAYFASAERLANALLRGFASALNLGPDYFDQYFVAPHTMLKLNHYPPQDSPESIKHIGVVPHTDSGAFTILWQDEGDGLEIQNKDGEWIGAPSHPGHFRHQYRKPDADLERRAVFLNAAPGHQPRRPRPLLDPDVRQSGPRGPGRAARRRTGATD